LPWSGGKRGIGSDVRVHDCSATFEYVEDTGDARKRCRDEVHTPLAGRRGHVALSVVASKRSTPVCLARFRTDDECSRWKGKMKSKLSFRAKNMANSHRRRFMMTEERAREEYAWQNAVPHQTPCVVEIVNISTDTIFFLPAVFCNAFLRGLTTYIKI
jgi:hypothetical protein